MQNALSSHTDISVSYYPDWDFNLEYSYNRLLKQFNTISLKSFGLEQNDPEIAPAGFLLDYLDKTTNTKIPHISSLDIYSDCDFLMMDDSSRRNLEITENAAINSPEAFNQTIQDLRNMRFCFSLDDYGSGYSNASNIFNLDFDYIKVDKSILWNADERASAKIVLNNTVEMIRQMNLKVIMEGVQTAEQKNYISSRGIDYIQGFYFSSPLPEADFLKYIEDFNNGNLPQAKE